MTGDKGKQNDQPASRAPSATDDASTAQVVGDNAAPQPDSNVAKVANVGGNAQTQLPPFMSPPPMCGPHFQPTSPTSMPPPPPPRRAALRYGDSMGPPLPPPRPRVNAQSSTDEAGGPAEVREAESSRPSKRRRSGPRGGGRSSATSGDVEDRSGSPRRRGGRNGRRRGRGRGFRNKDNDTKGKLLRRGTRGKGKGAVCVADLVDGPFVREGKPIFNHGNYDPYYAQRHDRFATVDRRLECLLKKCGPNMFTGKNVLDIGCNSGFISYLVANLGAARVEGVDIDIRLISATLKHLRWLKKNGHKTMPTASDAEVPGLLFPRSLVHSRGVAPYIAKPLLKQSCSSSRPVRQDPPLANTTGKIAPREEALPKPDGNGKTAADAAVPAEGTRDGPCDSDATFPESPLQDVGTEVPGTIEGDCVPVVGFPHNLEFRSADILVSEVEQTRPEPYDILLCLKLTKWVHLNRGDDGIRELFKKCFNILRPGGLLVLEAQEWVSYFCSKHLTPTARAMRWELKMRPDEFSVYLTSVIGFKQAGHVGSCPPLKRPLMLLRKPLESERAGISSMRPDATEGERSTSTVELLASTDPVLAASLSVLTGAPTDESDKRGVAVESRVGADLAEGTSTAVIVSDSSAVGDNPDEDRRTK